MSNIIIFNDDEVNSLSKRFFTQIVSDFSSLEDFKDIFELLDIYGAKVILECGGFDGDVRLTSKQFGMIWENYKTVNYEFKHGNKNTDE